MFNESDLKTRVSFKEDARKGLLKGITVVAQAVGCTLGPRGKTVIIQHPGQAPVVTKDGVTVSKAIRLKDPVEGLGADLIKQAAERTNEVAGDGTTTSTVLTHAMIIEGNKLLSGDYNAQEMCKGIELAVDLTVQQLLTDARQIKTTEEIAQVATISANGDKKIGDLVAQAMEKVGRDGIITVEDAKGMNTTLEVVEGLQFERGYLSPYFVNNQDKMHAAYEGARVLITDKKLASLQQLVPVLEKVMAARVPLLIIAEDVEGEALQALVLNRVKANLPVVVVKAPGYGQYRDELLSDLCVLTGGKLVSSRTGLALEKVELADLGAVKKIVVDSRVTTIVGDGKTSATIKSTIESLKARLVDVTLNHEDLAKLKARIAGLSAGVAVIRVGGATELEMIERKHRIEDALHATRAAAEEGIVPGGGIALLRAASEIRSRTTDKLPRDVQAGFTLVQRACAAPLQQIVSNAAGSPDVIIHQAMQAPVGHGYDAVKEEFRDMFEAGIVDPVKVSRAALVHAASVATTFLTLDAVVFVDEENK